LLPKIRVFKPASLRFIQFYEIWKVFLPSKLVQKG
jgi:hypothetical protein